jgi:organic radical activating enzyme
MRIEIDITRECNWKCNFCNRLCNLKSKNPDTIMNMDDIYDITNQLSKYKNNIDLITIIGGEPTLNPNCLNICEYICSQFENKIFLRTNGSSNLDDYKLLSSKYNNFIIDYDNIKTLNFKNIDHLNIFLSPKENNQKTGNKNHKDCWMVRSCGIDVSKHNNQLKWFYCPFYMITILLDKVYLLKDKLDDLLNDNIHNYDICSHCQFNAIDKDKIRYNSSNENNISNCFKIGLHKYLCN